jgi:hypothetical protein
MLCKKDIHLHPVEQCAQFPTVSEPSEERQSIRTSVSIGDWRGLNDWQWEIGCDRVRKAGLYRVIFTVLRITPTAVPDVHGTRPWHPFDCLTYAAMACSGTFRSF